ncbi:MAG TPA: hypothetical protein VIF60_07905 [Burkholderiaceae bacterium]
MAAIATALLALGHTFGNPWLPELGNGAHSVIEAMAAYRFDIEGMTRSYHDFYIGFGWMLSAYLFGHVVMLWLLSGMVGGEMAGPRLIVCVLFVESLALLTMSWAFLFLVPVIMNFAIAMLLGGAWWAMRDSVPAAELNAAN